MKEQVISKIRKEEEKEQTFEKRCYGRYVGSFPLANILVARDGNLPKDAELAIGAKTIGDIIKLLNEKYASQEVVTLSDDWISFFVNFGEKAPASQFSLEVLLRLGILPLLKAPEKPFLYRDLNDFIAVIESYRAINARIRPYHRVFLPDWVFEGVDTRNLCKSLNEHMDLLNKLQNLGTDFVKGYGEYLVKRYPKDYLRISEEIYVTIGCPEWIHAPNTDMNVMILYLTNLKLHKFAPEDGIDAGTVVDKYYDSEVLFGTLLQAIEANANNIRLCPLTLSESEKEAVTQAALKSDIPLDDCDVAETVGLNQYARYLREDVKFLKTANLFTFSPDAPIIRSIHTIKGFITVLKRHDGEEQLSTLLRLGISRMHVNNEKDVTELIEAIYQLRNKVPFDLQLKVVRCLCSILQWFEEMEQLSHKDIMLIRRIDDILKGITNTDMERWMVTYPPILGVEKISRVIFNLHYKSKPLLTGAGTIDSVFEWYPTAEMTNVQFIRLVSLYDGYIRFNYRPLRGNCTNFAECCAYDAETILDLIVNKDKIGYLLDLPADLQALLANALTEKYHLETNKQSIIHLLKSMFKQKDVPE